MTPKPAPPPRNYGPPRPTSSSAAVSPYEPDPTAHRRGSDLPPELSRYDPESSVGDDVDPELLRDIIGEDLIMPAEKKAMREKRNRRLWIAVGLIALAGMTIGTFALLASHHHLSVFHGGGGDQGAAALVVPTPDIHVVCSMESLESPTGYARCEQMCRPGMCCLADRSDSSSCAGNEEYRRACHEYRVCSNLASAEKPRAYAAGGAGTSNETSSTAETIESACSLEGVTVPGMRSVCEAACEPGACCFDESAADCPVDCPDYAPCSHLHGATPGDDGEAVGASTRSVVDALCSPAVLDGDDEDDILECEEACDLADCCFSPPTCLQSGVDVNCLDYVSCARLYEVDDTDEERDEDDEEDEDEDEDEAGASLGVVSRDIDEACSAAALSDEAGEAKCLGLCREADCCWNVEGGTCYGRKVDVACHAYLACAALYDETLAAEVRIDEKIDAEQMDEVTSKMKEALEGEEGGGEGGGEGEAEDAASLPKIDGEITKEDKGAEKEKEKEKEAEEEKEEEEKGAEEEKEEADETATEGEAEAEGAEETGGAADEGVIQGWAPSVCAPNFGTAVHLCRSPGFAICDDPVSPTNRPCHVRCDEEYGFGEKACTGDDECVKFVRGCRCPIPPCEEEDEGGTEAGEGEEEEESASAGVAAAAPGSGAGDGLPSGWAPSVCARDWTAAYEMCRNLPVCDDPADPTNRPCHMRCDDVTGFGEVACRAEEGERCVEFVEGCKCPRPPCAEEEE